MSSAVLACQALALLWTIIVAAVRVAADLPVALFHCAAASLGSGSGVAPGQSSSCAFYEGTVKHSRTRPVYHAFQYPVRMAVVDLDAPPPWFGGQARDHLTADAARQMAGTAGGVRLLTHPIAAGYTQNPISVYYCLDTSGMLIRCIAEVTNTPWGERVRFAFDPDGDTTDKTLHVSPLMDMRGQWTLKAAAPGKRLALSVSVRHPQLGPFFRASLSAARCSADAWATNERAGLATLWRYGYQPQRVALWIYWQAVLLLRKGVQFHGPPSPVEAANIQRRARAADKKGTRNFTWCPAASFPWRT